MRAEVARVTSATLFFLPVLACGGDPGLPSVSLWELSDVKPAEWSALASRRVFFGHQSVGENVMQGVSEVLAAHPELHLTVIESKNLNPGATPGFYHAKVGRNEHPEEKAVEFAQIAARALLAPGSVGMVKFCYVDVQSDTDPNALFGEYRERMADLEARKPGLTIVHFTMPLHTDQGTLGHWKQKLRGYATERDLNVLRNRYNALLRQTYIGKEPVFDIAALESRHPDGSRAYFQRAGEIVYTLAPELSTDGGHLTEGAQRMVGEQGQKIFAAGAEPPPHDGCGHRKRSGEWRVLPKIVQPDVCLLGHG